VRVWAKNDYLLENGKNRSQMCKNLKLSLQIWTILLILQAKTESIGKMTKKRSVNL